jgi:ketosteroid isomerase-like protein
MSLKRDVEAVGRRRQDWIAAVNLRDVDACLDLLTEDVIWIPPG